MVNFRILLKMAAKEEEGKESPLVDVSEFIKSPLGVHGLQSSLPPSTTQEECLMGIDEAGRGPVLGPMVYGICYCPLSKQDRLKEMKFADSKTLSVSKREQLYSSIVTANEWLGWKATILSPNYLSNCMLKRSKYNLNSISHDTAIDLIKKVLADGVKLSEVYLDTVGEPRAYQSKLMSIFPQLKITVAKKADSLYPIVSAASICAKVIRDACLNEWKFIEGEDRYSRTFGCGYPSDEATKKWLKDSVDPVFGFPSLVRFSWSTCENILESKALPVRWPDEEEEDESLIGCTKISNYFSLKTDCPKPPKRHRFFEERHMSVVEIF